MDPTVIKTITAKLVSLQTYEYIINNNVNNRHWTDSEELYNIISKFFIEDMKKLDVLRKLLKEKASFEIDLEEGKMFLLKNNRKEEMRKLHRANLKKFTHIDEYAKNSTQSSSSYSLEGLDWNTFLSRLPK